MAEKLTVSASIVTHNNGKIIKKTVTDILNNTVKLPLKLYCVDNCSSDNTVSVLGKIEGIKLIKNNKNIGFGKGHNTVLGEALGKYHFIINPDISVSYDVLSEIALFMEQNPDIVLLRPEILNQDGTVQHLPIKKPTFKRLFFGRVVPKIREEYTHTQEEDIDFCSGCFMCIKSDAFKKLKGFDPDFFMYLEDADLTLRAQSEGRTVISRQFFVTHKWERGSAKSLKLFLIHLISAIKFLIKVKKYENAHNRS